MYHITLMNPTRKIIRIFFVDSIDHEDILKAQNEGYTEIIQIFEGTLHFI